MLKEGWRERLCSCIELGYVQHWARCLAVEQAEQACSQRLHCLVQVLASVISWSVCVSGEVVCGLLCAGRELHSRGPCLLEESIGYGGLCDWPDFHNLRHGSMRHSEAVPTSNAAMAHAMHTAAWWIS